MILLFEFKPWGRRSWVSGVLCLVLLNAADMLRGEPCTDVRSLRETVLLLHCRHTGRACQIQTETPLYGRTAVSVLLRMRTRLQIVDCRTTVCILAARVMAGYCLWIRRSVFGRLLVRSANGWILARQCSEKGAAISDASRGQIQC